MTGDLVFRTENGWISRMVLQMQGDDRYSHVGVVIVQDGAPRVFHAEIDPDTGARGVISQDVCTYLRRSVRAELRRPQALSDFDRAALAQAVGEIGARPFNTRLSWSPEEGSVYCTQYVWQVFERALPGRVFGHHPGGVLTVTQLLDSQALRDVSPRDASHANSGAAGGTM